MVKRVNCPEDLEKAHIGGFIVAQTENGKSISRSPATDYVILILPQILSLLRILNQLYLPQNQVLIAKDLRCSFGIPDAEKKVLLGVINADSDPFDPNPQIKQKTSFDNMQTFLTMLFDNCYHLMGGVCLTLGREFYALPGLATALINSSLSNLESLPDFKLRTIVWVFLRRFVYASPPTFYDDTVLPVFGHFAPFSKLALKI